MNKSLYAAFFAISALTALHASDCKKLKFLKNQACFKALIVQDACLAADAVFNEPRFVNFNYDTACSADIKALHNAIKVRRFICEQDPKYWADAIIARQTFERCESKK